MIKVFSNKTTSPKIKVESKFVVNKTTVKKDNLLTGVTKNDLLFVKLIFSGLHSPQIINSVKLRMFFKNAYSNIGVKVIKCNDSSISDTNVKALSKNFNGDEEVIEKTTIYGSGHSLKKTEDQSFVLDITNVINKASSINTTVMLAISFPFGTTSDFGVYSPQALTKDNEICIATMSEIVGINSMYNYDEHDFGRCGKVSVNLATGKPIYTLNLLSSVGKKMPISFSICQNADKNEATYFANRVIPNFHYNIYKDEGYYVIEDPTGFKNYYSKIEYEAENRSDLTDNYGIKHLENSGDIYLSHLDNSYIFVIESGNLTKIKLYDKSDTRIDFEIVSGICKILMAETALEYKLTYTWSGSRLEKIVNTDGEEMLISYSSGGHIEKVSFPDLERAIDFTEDYVNQTLKLRTYYYNKTGAGSATQTTTETICETKLYFSSNSLFKVEDIATGQYLKVLYDSLKRATSIGIYNATGLEKTYLTTYQYNSKFTKVSNIEGNAIHYCFDDYGRVKTTMDDKARTVTYNYDEFENGESLRLIGKSKTQNNARNLLENHSFENENIFSSQHMSWKILGSTGSKGEVVADGVLGEKCLKLCAVSSDKASIYQTIVNPKAGDYVLKGFIKHPDISAFSKDDVTVGISGTYTIEEEVIVRVNSNTTKTEMRPVTRSYKSLAVLDFSKTSWYSFVTPKVPIPTGASNITMTVELIVNHKSTTIYLDDMQLTNSTFFTRYNLIENGYMEFVSNNRPYGWLFNNFDAEDQIVKIASNETHPSLLGDNVMRIAPGNTARADLGNIYKVKKMYKEIPLNGLAGEQLIFSVFGKGCVTDNVIFRAYIKFVYENKGEVYSQFDFEKHFDNWQMLTRAVTAEDNFREVTIGIVYDGGGEVMLDCFQLYKDSFGKYYNYDAKGNITEVIDGTNTRITYDEDNKVDEIYSADGSYFKYNYDSKGRVSKVTDLNKNRVDITYDDDDRIVKTTITSSDGEKIENTMTYNDATNKETITDEFGNMFTTSMDYLKRVTSQLDANGLETEFAYNHKSELEEMYAVVESVTHKNSFTYDVQGNTKTVQATNGTLYDLTYDTFGRLLSIKCNGRYLEQYQYDPSIDGYKKGELQKKILGSNGDFYEFKYDDLGQVIETKLNGVSLATYSYDENGNVYELYDVKSQVSSYFTYDLQGHLLKKRSSDGSAISYTYDNLGNVQKATYNINNAVRSIDYEYDYEFNEYTKEGYFNRLSNLYGDEVVVSGHGAKGQYGAKPLFTTCSHTSDPDLNMNVFDFTDKYDFINYETKTFNTNRTSGVVNGKIYSYAGWSSRFANNKTFYAFVKPSGSYTKENLFTFGFSEDFESGSTDIRLYSNLCITADGKIAYYSEGGNEKSITTEQVKLNAWNLVAIKLYKEANGVDKAQISLNGETFDPFEIDEKVNAINYLLIGYQTNLMPNVATTKSSGKKPGSANLNMPFKICLLSFGSYDYKGEDFKAIYQEGLKYLFKQPIVKSHGTIYYDDKTYQGFDVVTLNGSLESAKGLRPLKIATLDQSYRFDKTRLFKYDEEAGKHVFGSYRGIANLNPGITSTLRYKLPLSKEGTVSLRFKAEPVSEIRCLLSLVNASKEVIGLYLNKSHQLTLQVNTTIVTSSNTKFVNDTTWHQVVIRFKNNTLQVYLDDMTSPLYEGTNTITLVDPIIHLGNVKTGLQAFNGCLEMFAYSDQYVTDNKVNQLFAHGQTIIVRNKLDTLGRVNENQILIEDKEFSTTYDYDKTRVSKQTFHNGDSLAYSYDSMNNVTAKTTSENEVQSKVQYTYDQLGRLKSETREDGEVERFTYYPNGNIRYREVIRNNIVVIKEEYQYDTVIKDKLLRIKDLISNRTVQDITYSFDFYPSKMLIKGKLNPLVWTGRRLTGITGCSYQYNSNGIRTKKITPNETTTFDLEGSNIISMNKVTPTENVRLDFVYDASSTLIGVNTSEGNYFYIRDITGNIIGLIDNEGKYIVKYRYDAWGKVLEKKIYESCIASRHNPFVYKGYFLDEETGFYYLKSRYYDPTIRRFIIIDSPQYIDPQDLSGLNLFAYCGNNPVMYYDPTGHFPWLILAAVLLFTPLGGFVTQVVASAVSYVAMSVWALGDLIFNHGNGAWNDMCNINWNPFNSDESKVMNSNNISFYKGIPVFHISGMGGSMSLGAIWFDKGQGIDVLKHERGHNTQLMSMGLGNYLIQIGIPSVWKNGDETPWELSASMLGGSSLANGYSNQQKEQARNYFIRSIIPIVNIYNVFQYIFY